MTNLFKKTIFIAVICLIPMISMAQQQDNFGIRDTLYAELAKLDANNWTITVSYTNDQSVVAFSVPLKMTAGMNRVVADSAVFTGGRAETYAYKGFRPDTAIQCVTLGLIGTLSAKHVYTPPGSGRIATIFVSSLDGSPIENLKIDTTTTSPNNSLMVIADRVQGENMQDTIPLTERDVVNIYPAFVIIEPK
ncbi:MAG: hypothetical protein DWP97_06060 [Calditrichaeota bacterium]|nr:MAG: hypothetical protein DWP97_06060 [Calditrichota bacterium]